MRDRAYRLAGRADELAEHSNSFERWLDVPVARHESVEPPRGTLDYEASTDLDALDDALQGMGVHINWECVAR